MAKRGVGLSVYVAVKNTESQTKQSEGQTYESKIKAGVKRIEQCSNIDDTRAAYTKVRLKMRIISII